MVVAQVGFTSVGLGMGAGVACGVLAAKGAARGKRGLLPEK